MLVNTKAILIELHNMRMQIQDLQNQVNFLNKNQTNLNSQIYRKEDYSNYCSNNYSDDNSCSLISFVIDWMPFWIFISFVLFAFIGKPSRLCSISSGVGSAVGSAASGVCPFSGLGSLGEFVTKL